MDRLKQVFIVNREQAYDAFADHKPMRTDQGGMFLCSAGSGEVKLNNKEHKIEKNDLVLAFPFSIIQLLSYSNDFDGTVIKVDQSFFNTLDISDKSSHFLFISDNPCVKLSDEEVEKITKIESFLQSEIDNTDHPFRVEIDNSIARILSYEIAAMCLKRKPDSPQIHSRDNAIFQNFIASLFVNFKHERTLTFYSSQQQLSPRYLSMIIKRVSGRTASQWISSYIITNIKSTLYSSAKSIKEVSDEYNFANASFFTQYFRKYSGVTPSQFRSVVNQ